MIAAHHSMLDSFIFDAEVEYLETSANSGTYLRLPVNVSGVGEHMSFTLDVQYLDTLRGSITTQLEGFGYSYSYGSSSAYLYACINGQTSEQGSSAFGVGTPSWYFNFGTEDTSRHTFGANTERATAYFDGNGVLCPYGTEKQIRMTNFGLFCICKENGSALHVCSLPVRLFSFKLTVGTAQKFNMIPVRKGNTGFLYNKVTGQLHGKEDGADFIIGPDKQL